MMASALKRGQDQDWNEEESMSDVSEGGRKPNRGGLWPVETKSGLECP